MIAGFSISGLPLLAGFGAKVMTLKDLLPWQEIVMNGAIVGTTIVYAKFIFLPQETFSPADHKPQSWGFWSAIALLLGSLVLANGFYLQVYTVENILKAIAVIALGWLAYWGLIRRWPQAFSREPEKFEHLMGAMSLMLILLFWIGWSKWEPLF
jgi:multicomponent Na+:H+ antiporter subunit D